MPISSRWTRARGTTKIVASLPCGVTQRQLLHPFASANSLRPVATQLKLAYGLREERLLHITKVANGLACACTCPGCRARLVARNQGTRKVPHFAHYQAPECAHGLQTALHLAAKDIISRHRQFRLPGAAGTFTFTDNFWASFTFNAAHYESCISGDVGVPAEYAIPPRYLDVERVTLERKTHDIVPDIILHTSAGELLVEVAVTHFVDEVKREKIKQLGISCVEIDLSKMDRAVDFAQLEEVLIHGVEQKRWIFNAKLRAKLQQLRQRYFDAARPFFHEAHVGETEHRNQEPTPAWKRAQRAKDEATRAAGKQARNAEKERQAEQQKQRRLVQQQLDNEFYATQLRPVTKREIPSGNSRPPIIRLHVLSCPLAEREFEGQRYGSADADCPRCGHYKGYWETEQAVVCLLQPFTAAP